MIAAPAGPARTQHAPAQAALALLALVASVAVTVVLVAPASATRRAEPRPAPVSTLPGVRVEVRGGDAFLAYGVADRLSGAGASLRAVAPASEGELVEASTTIVYYERSSLPAADRVRELLGERGTLRRQRAFAPDVDVTIVLGKDLSRL
jgi:hypothetical protein